MDRGVRTHSWTMNVPECALLGIEDFPLHLVTPFVDLRLGLGLHENEFPFPAEHPLQPGKIFRLVVRQPHLRLILHSPFAQINGYPVREREREKKEGWIYIFPWRLFITLSPTVFDSLRISRFIALLVSIFILPLPRRRMDSDFQALTIIEFTLLEKPIRARLSTHLPRALQREIARRWISFRARARHSSYLLF